MVSMCLCQSLYLFSGMSLGIAIFIFVTRYKKIVLISILYKKKISLVLVKFLVLLSIFHLSGIHY